MGPWCPWRHLSREAEADIHVSLEQTMSKRARKRRSRKGNAANHGRKPNA
jgi:hypothetical protein